MKKSVSLFAGAAVAAVLASPALAVPPAGTPTYAVVDPTNLPAGGNVVYSFDLLPDQVLSFMTTPLATRFGSPDTIVEVRDSANNLIVSNDDGGAGNVGGVSVTNFGSATRFRTTTGGTFTVTVRGFSPTESGAFASTYSVLGTDAPNFVSNGANGSAATAQAVALSAGQATIGTGVVAGTAREYFAFTLNAGEIFSAITAPLNGTSFRSPDTIIELRDAADNLIFSNDDAGSGATDNAVFSSFGSALRFEATQSGTYFLTVRGFDSTEAGAYALTASIVPTPGAAGLLGLAGLVAARRRRA